MKSRRRGARHEKARFERREKSENIGEGIVVRRWVRGKWTRARREIRACLASKSHITLGRLRMGRRVSRVSGQGRDSSA